MLAVRFRSVAVIGISLPRRPTTAWSENTRSD